MPKIVYITKSTSSKTLRHSILKTQTKNVIPKTNTNLKVAKIACFTGASAFCGIMATQSTNYQNICEQGEILFKITLKRQLSSLMAINQVYKSFFSLFTN